jgi:hypothetical protein
VRRTVLAAFVVSSAACGGLLGIDEDAPAPVVVSTDAAAGGDAGASTSDATGGSDGAPSGFVCPPNAIVCDAFERQDVGAGQVGWVEESTTNGSGTFGIVSGGLVATLPASARNVFHRVRDSLPEKLPEGSHVVTVILGFSYQASTTSTGSPSYTDLMLVTFMDRNGASKHANLALSANDLPDIDYDLDGITLEAPMTKGAFHALTYTIPFGGGSASVSVDGTPVAAMTLPYAQLLADTTVELMLGPDLVNREGSVNVRYEYVAVTASP